MRGHSAARPRAKSNACQTDPIKSDHVKEKTHRETREETEG